MKYTNLFIAAFTTLLGISSCTDYEPIFGVVDIEQPPQSGIVHDLAYIHKDDVYLVDEILGQERQLTNSPAIKKTDVALSPERDQIAYLDQAGTPVILDTLGGVITTLTQITNAQDLVWYTNNGDQTLCILVNNAISFYGTALSLPATPFEYAFPADATDIFVDALDIDENLNIGFSFRYQRPSGTAQRSYYHGLGVNYAGSATDQVTVSNDGNYSPGPGSTYNDQSYPYYYYVDFNTGANNLTTGEIFNGLENNLTAYKVYSYDYQNAGGITAQTASVNSASFFLENSVGTMSANAQQLRKVFNMPLPPNIPEPVGSTNTFTVNLIEINDTPPFYFDWQPR